MTTLFELSEINGMKLQNRFVRSATWEGLAADDGSCTPRLVDLMVTLAKGGVGLIITSHAYVQKVGQASGGQLGIHNDDMIPGLKEMTAAVHDQNGKIICQLAHAGFFGNAKLSGQTPIAPSAIDGIAEGMRKEMTAEDIQSVVAAFAAAAHRAKIAGFDGVQIHGAHGYLLKECAREDLVTAIHAVVAGQIYVSPGLGDAVLEGYRAEGGEGSALALLTPREREILQLLAEGHGARDIAARLGVSVKTVGTHRENLMRKAGTRSLSGLTKLAIREGMTSVEE